MKDENLKTNPISQLNFPSTNPIIYFPDNASIDDYFSGNVSTGDDWANAHVLKNLELDGSLTRTCIQFNETSEYVIIQNCTIKNAKNGEFGILLDHSDYIKIVNCTFINCDNATFIYGCYNSSIFDCEFYGNTKAIEFSYSYYANATENYISGSQSGVKINWDTANLFSNNTIKNSENGILIYGGWECVISNNEISDLSTNGIYTYAISEVGENALIENNTINNVEDTAGYGIFGGMVDCIFTNNILKNIGGTGIRAYKSGSYVINNSVIDVGTGMQIEAGCDGALNNTIENAITAGMRLISQDDSNLVGYNELTACDFVLTLPDVSFEFNGTNTVNGKPIYYEHSNSAVNLQSTSAYGQVILYNCIDSVLDSVITGAIYLDESPFAQIKDCEVSALCNGMKLDNCDNSTISGTIGSGFTNYGINIQDSDNFTLENVDFSCAQIDGISIYNSESSKIIECNFSENMFYGINLYNCDDIIVKNTVCSSNQNDGFQIRLSENASVIECDASNNNGVGYSISQSSDESEILNCSASNNGYGIVINTPILIAKDNFLKNNTEEGISVIDNTHNLAFDTDLLGNKILESKIGIKIYDITYANSYVSIESNNITNCEYGIDIMNVVNCEIIDNNISHIDNNGIDLESVNYINVSLNEIIDVEFGIVYSLITSGSITYNIIEFRSECISGDTSSVDVSNNKCSRYTTNKFPIEIVVYISIVIFGIVAIIFFSKKMEKKKRK